MSWPHLTGIRDPAVLETELARVRSLWNTVRLHGTLNDIPPVEFEAAYRHTTETKQQVGIQ